MPTNDSHMPEKRHFYWLDWIRFLAAFMVMTAHARGGNWVEWARLAPDDHTRFVQAFFTVTRAGLEWGIVFFVLSGFLVGGQALERSLHRTFDPYAYARDRISRIWLPLIPALLLTAGVQLFCGTSISFPIMLGNIFGLNGVLCPTFGNNDPLWSLSYEMWFYALAGIAAIILTRFSSRTMLWAALTLCLAVFTRLNATFLDCWLLGAFSYFLSSYKRGASIGVPGLILFLLGACFSQLQAESKSVSLESIWPWLPSPELAWLIESLGIGLVLAGVCHGKPRSARWSRIEGLGTWLASFSYTLYLTHYPILAVWDRLLPQRHVQVDVPTFLIFFCKIASCLAVAWLMYLPFEAQTSKVRKWLKEHFSSLAPEKESS